MLVISLFLYPFFFSSLTHCHFSVALCDRKLNSLVWKLPSYVLYSFVIHIHNVIVVGKQVIRENWNLKYSACFVLCPLRTAELNVPQSVSIVSRLRAPPGNILRVRNTDQDPDFVNRTATSSPASSSSSSSASSSSPVDHIADKIAICVKPFHFNYDQALYLMEYLEFNSLLGVSHFTFYNHTLGSRATCVLNHYIDGTIPANLTAADADKPEFLVKESSTPDGELFVCVCMLFNM